MLKKSLAVGIIFLFLISSITPMVFGYNEKSSCSSDEENKIYEKSTSSSGPMDSPWPMKCHDLHHTGRSPYSTADNPGIEKWRFKCNWIEDGIVIGNDGTLYFGDTHAYFFALNPNGTLKWKYKTGERITSSPAIAEDGTIYVGSWDRKLYAFYPDGTLKWKENSGDGVIASSPAIANDGTIYVGTMRDFDKGDVVAFYPNGTKRWIYETGYLITSDPAIGDDGTIYIGSGDTYLYALYPNGTLRWRFKTGHYVKGPPSIADDGTIYIGSWDDYLYALYPNGSMKWKCKVGTGTETNPSIASDGTIYVGGQKLYAINPGGTIKWSFDLGSERHIHHSSPAISSDDTIYTGVKIGDGAGGEIIAVNPDGTEKWRKKIAEFRVESSPCIGEDGTVYIGSSYDMGGGYLYAFNRAELEAHADGPEHGLINVPVQFTGSASGGYSPYSYHWDLGDETTSTEQNPTHTYANPGDFTVTLTVTDEQDNTSSDTIWIHIQDTNSPPNTPTIDGPTNGDYDTKYDYTISTIDLDDNPVYYYVEWGDGKDTGWIGQYDSGEEIIKSHKWTDRGAYTIRVKAKDVFDEESDWATLEVSMPKNKSYINIPFLQFLENHPNLFPLLRKIFD